MNTRLRLDGDLIWIKNFELEFQPTLISSIFEVNYNHELSINREEWIWNLLIWKSSKQVKWIWSYGFNIHGFKYFNLNTSLKKDPDVYSYHCVFSLQCWCICYDDFELKLFPFAGYPLKYVILESSFSSDTVSDFMHFSFRSNHETANCCFFGLISYVFSHYDLQIIFFWNSRNACSILYDA